MTTIELIKHLRESILDDTGGMGVDWTGLTEDDIDNHQLRWSNEELARFINEAQNKAAIGSLLFRKSEDDFAIDVIAGEAYYAYDPRIIRLKGVTLDSQGKVLHPVDFEELSYIRRWREREGIPTRYVVDEMARKIRLYPIPLNNDTIYLIYNRLPLEQVTWDLPDAENEVPREYQVDMLNYAAYMAYSKDEANSLDAQKAMTHLQLFTAQFSNNNAYADVSRRRKSGRTIQYRDL